MRNSTVYGPAGTKTFRLSSKSILATKVLVDGKRKKKGWGSNMANIEKNLRSIYKPDGYTPSLAEKCLYYMETKDLSVFTAEELEKLRIFIQTDQSGAEALIVAYLTVAGQYRELFKHKIKPHSYLGMHLFSYIWPDKMREYGLMSGDSDFDIKAMCSRSIGELKQNKWWKPLGNLIKSTDDWPMDQRYYYLAKQTEHSSNYDVGANTFRMNVLEKSGGKVVISSEEAARFLDVKHGLFPEIRGYHRWVRRLAENNKIIYNLHGHPYTITHYEILDSHLKEIYAWIPQSTVGEITNIAYTRMYEYIRDNKKRWDLLANTHDSYLLQCPLSEELECAAKAKQLIEQRFKSPIDGAEFQMGSETQSGFNWSPYKKGKNDLGLREIVLP